MKVWAVDECRVGIRTIERRCITARGVKPIGIHQHEFKSGYVYGAVDPVDGEARFIYGLTNDTATFQHFLTIIADEDPDHFHVLIVDNARIHTTQKLAVPANVALLFQPPYAPEVNPAERVWLHLKTALAWQCWTSLLELGERMCAVVAGWSHQTIQSLTAYPYLVQGITAAFSS